MSYINNLNDQIYKLETQIDNLKNKVLDLNKQNKEIMLDKEQYDISVQNLNTIIKEEKIKNQNLENVIFELKNKVMLINTKDNLCSQSNKGIIQSESENECVNQVINDLHNQIDGLNNINENEIYYRNKHINDFKNNIYTIK